MSKATQETKVRIGEIWLTKSVPCSPTGRDLPKIEDPAYVVILLDDEDAYDSAYPDIRVAPVSRQIRYASDMDLILSKGQNPLKIDIMIEIWNSQPMLKMNLDRFCGNLSEETIEQLGRLQQKLWGMEVNTEDIYTGEPISKEYDERMAFQEKEIERTLYLRGPFNELVEKWELEESPVFPHEQIEEMYKRIVSVGSRLYTILTCPVRGVERVGVIGASAERRQVYDNEAFRGEIYKEKDMLFLELAAKIEALIGKYVVISIPSAYQVDYESRTVKWAQGGPERIVSDSPIDPGGRVKVKIAETRLDPDKGEASHLLGQIFEEVRLEIFDGESEAEENLS